MTPELSTLHAAAVAALHESALAAIELGKAREVAEYSAAHWAHTQARDKVRKCIDALAVFAECLEIKAGR